MTKKDKMWVMESSLDLIKNKVSLSFMNKSHVYTEVGNKDSRCGGFFCEDPLSMEVAVKKSFKRWFTVFIHEYNHYVQYRDKTKSWKIISKLESKTDFDLNSWLYHGKEYDNNVSDTYINALRDFELECETMSVHTILENDLSIDVQDYIKQANAYIYFYNVVRDERKWCKIAPYSIQEVIDIMPDELITNPSNISKEIYDIIKTTCL